MTDRLPREVRDTLATLAAEHPDVTDTLRNALEDAIAARQFPLARCKACRADTAGTCVPHTGERLLAAYYADLADVIPWSAKAVR